MIYFRVDEFRLLSELSSLNLSQGVFKVTVESYVFTSSIYKEECGSVTVNNSHKHKETVQGEFVEEQH